MVNLVTTTTAIGKQGAGEVPGALAMSPLDLRD